MISLDKIFKIKPSGIKLESGKLLISGPFLHDFFFGRSVILMAEHNENGSMGFIVNKPTDFFVADMIVGFPDMDMPLYAGGPVQTDSVFIMHRRPDIIDDSQSIAGDISWGGNFNQIQDYLKQGILQPKDIRFFLGYSGWDREQLDKEISKESWIIGNLKYSENIFDNTDIDLWEKIVKSFGSKYSNWLNFPANPTDN